MRLLYGAEVFKNPLQMLGYLYYIPAFTVGKMYKVMVAERCFHLWRWIEYTVLFGKMQDGTVGTDLCICGCICTDGDIYNIKQPEYFGYFKMYLPDQWTCLYEQPGGRIACQKLCTDRQRILLDAIYYCNCSRNLDSGMSGRNSGELL